MIIIILIIRITELGQRALQALGGQLVRLGYEGRAGAHVQAPQDVFCLCFTRKRKQL